MLSMRLGRFGALNFVLLAGHALAVTAVAALLIARATGPAIAVTATLGAAYVALARRTGEAAHLWPGSLFLAAAYLLVVGLVGQRDALLLWVLPLVLALSVIAMVFRQRSLPRWAAPLEVTAHVAALYQAVYLWAHGPLLRVPLLTVVALAMLVALDLGLARLHRQRWFLYGAALYLSLAYLYVLRFAPGGPSASLLPLFAGSSTVLALAGWGLRAMRRPELAEPVELAALTVAGAAGLAALWAGNTTGLHALIVIALTYGLLYASARAEEYIYLIILAAGAIGFQFLRISGRRFSPRLTDQFLLGLVIVGVLFFYPLIRRAFSAEGSLQAWFNAGRWPRVLLVGLPVFGLALLTGVSYTFEATANPSFCGACHNMGPQYLAWDVGTHRDISCDTCHYPPGAQNFVQGKVVGLTEVVNYLAGTYGTKPHGTVDNANCSACHAPEALIGVSAPYRAKIRFDHIELQPGKGLGITPRCNNCHAHIVDGLHFQVRESTCYWCHFMGRTGQNTAVGTCTTCHAVPNDNSHLDVQASTRDLDCTTAGCHDSVTTGDGAVRPERCLACHGQVDLRAGEAEAMHDLHIVAETTFLSRKVECLECHDEIAHGNETDLVPASLSGP